MTKTTQPIQAAGTGVHAPPQLRRILGLRDLIVYGLIIIQVVAPIPIFGLVQQRSNGHAATTILAAMVAMMLTAISYGRMAALYPMAGSAYTYVARSINPHLGFVTGWAMFLDYLIIPLMSIIIPALAIQRLISHTSWMPRVPFAVLALVIAVVMTLLNLRGLRTTTRTNLILLIVSGLAVIVFMVLAIRHMFLQSGWGGVFSVQPLYDPGKFRLQSILSGTSLAALTYIGFDGVTTLAEETINPRRNIVLATVLVCFIVGVLSATELYLFQLVWPDWSTFPNLDTAYLDIMRLVGGGLLFAGFSVVMSVSQFGSGFSGQAAAARLIYGMGRDNVLPRSVFGTLSPRTQHPARNILLVGLFAFAGALAVPFEVSCDLLNFGAFLGFMGVNLAALWSYYITPPESHRRRFFRDAVLPGAGFLFCLVIWLGLPHLSKVVGGIWLLIGIVFCAGRTRGFRERPVLFDFSES
jgi:amino acid transporter